MDESLIMFVCLDKGQYVVNCVMTLFSQEKAQQQGEKKMPKNGHISDNKVIALSFIKHKKNNKILPGISCAFLTQF